MTRVYAVSEDDVVYFGTIGECRRWIGEKGFTGQNPPDRWSVYKVSDYEDPDDDVDAYPLEVHDASDYIGFIVDAGMWNRWGAGTIEVARRIAARELSKSRGSVEIYRVGRTRPPVESYSYPDDMPKCARRRASGSKKGEGHNGKRGWHRHSLSWRTGTSSVPIRRMSMRTSVGIPAGDLQSAEPSE